MCECFICFPAVVVIALFFSGWLRGILSTCGSQLCCRIKREKGGHRHSDERMCVESGVWRGERERRSALPVRRGRAGLALSQPGHCAHEEAVCGTGSKRERRRHTCVWGRLCICMWSGQVVTQQESGGRQERGDSLASVMSPALLLLPGLVQTNNGGLTCSWTGILLLPPRSPWSNCHSSFNQAFVFFF